MSKKKQRAPQKPEPEDWHLEQEPVIAPKARPPKAVDPNEKARLDMTKRQGGLVKERWRWNGGRPEFDAYIPAKPRKKSK